MDPSKEQWAALYEAAQNVRQLSPWDFLYESDVITIMLPGRDEPVYCSVIGSGGECYGVGVYPGYESFNGFCRMCEADDEELSYLLGIEQNCMMCYFGSREQISPKDREVLKALDLHFRGRNEWIYFRTMDKGFLPWYINSEQAELLTHTLQNFTMACTDFFEDKLEVDFDSGETLLRFYSPEKDLWINSAERMAPIRIEKPRLIVNNEHLTAQLKKKKRNGAKLEFEVTYLPTPVQEHKKDRPYFPRLALLMDRTNGLALDQHMADMNDHIEGEILGMLTGYIDKFGRPLSIHVRDDRSGRYIGDFCEKTGIKVIEGEGMPAVDGLLEGMLDFLK